MKDCDTYQYLYLFIYVKKLHAQKKANGRTLARDWYGESKNKYFWKTTAIVAQMSLALL